MNEFAKDVKYALSAMARATLDFFKQSLEAALYIAVVVAIISAVGYCTVTWPYQTVTVFVMCVLVGWFIIELDGARFAREMTERDND